MIVVALALTGCGDGSVESSGAPTSDPTVTTRTVATTVPKLDRIKQCQNVLQVEAQAIQAQIDEGARLYLSKQPGLFEARSAAPVIALKAAQVCQDLLPECVTPASDWVQGIKYWAEEEANRYVRLDYGYVGLGPNPRPADTVRSDCF